MNSRLRSLGKRSALPALLVVAAAAAVIAQTQTARPAPAAPPAAGSDGHVVAEGRVVSYPGSQVEIGTELAGLLAKVNVLEKQAVKKGELLAALRADDLEAALAEARGRVAEAEADLHWAEAERARVEPLTGRGLETKNRLEKVQRDLDAAQARKATAEAAVARLNATVAKTRIVAPLDGVVLLRRVEPGQTVAAGDHLFTVADLARTRIEAEVDEFDSGRVRLGAAVAVTAEGFEGQSWRGKVEEIPDSVVPRRLRPQDPGKPSDTRVLLVKIALAEKTPLKLGQRVEISIAR